MLPQLRELELAYANELTVIGVHSGKFIAERETPHIRDASLRLDVLHPIVNDRQFRVWRSYAVRAWPTVVAVDARGLVIGQHAGEFTAEQLRPFLDQAIAAARSAGALVPGPLTFPIEGPTHPAGTLCYPGKVALGGERIAIADTGHHRVLVGRLAGDGTHIRVERVVGTGAPGLEDGTPGTLDGPQGMVFAGDTLFVADAMTHTIRAVDLATGALRTVAGTGYQLRTQADLAAGALSSPWDVTLADGTLYVAMAGTHQIYAVDPATGRARVHAGNRQEEIQDGPLLDAMLAQPMGITSGGAGGSGGRLWFADSETSAIRECDTNPAGSVRTLVGTGLFDFGDKDGVGDEVRLQHAQGVARHPDGRLLVADSYNNELKWLDPATRRVTTWVRGLHEPGGVACGERFAYVADTNAHRVCAVEYATGTVTPVEIEFSG